MQQPQNQRWQDWVTLVLGLWLIIAPLIAFGDSTATGAINSYIVGVIVAALSVWALAQPRSWAEWINLAVGLWLIISPFTLGFANNTALMWNHIIVGVLVGASAGWTAQARLTRQTGQKT